MAREVELEEMNIIIKVPKDALKVTVKVQVPGYDGEVMKVKKKLLKTDLDKARKDFLDNVEGGDDYDAKFVITDKGAKFLEEIHERQGHEEYPGYDIPKNELYSELERLGYWGADLWRQAAIARELGFPNAAELACHLYHLDVY